MILIKALSEAFYPKDEKHSKYSEIKFSLYQLTLKLRFPGAVITWLRLIKPHITFNHTHTSSVSLSALTTAKNIQNNQINTPEPKREF